MKKILNLLLCILLALALLMTGGALAETAAAESAAIDLTDLINAFLKLLAALVIYRLIPWLKANTSAKNQQVLTGMIRTAVYAAEQLYKTDQITDRLEYATNWLKDCGYTVDRAQIEAAVREMQFGALIELPSAATVTATLEGGTADGNA